MEDTEAVPWRIRGSSGGSRSGGSSSRVSRTPFHGCYNRSIMTVAEDITVIIQTVVTSEQRAMERGNYFP